MADGGATWVDRLAQTQWFERFGFFAFATAGSLFILGSKSAGVAAEITTIIACCIMLGYAAIQWFSKKGRIRSDQAGDNLYYLGLVYTLVGLAYAIFTFRPDTGTTKIIEGFGIALATTILGLILRVMFNQLRADLVEIEEQARMELAEAANNLKHELGQVTVQMSDFGRQTRQQLAEAISGVEASMLASVTQGTGSLAAMAKEAEEGIAQSFGDLKKRAQTLDSAVAKITASIEEHGSSTAGLASALEAMGPRIELLFKASEQIEKASSALERQASSSASLHQSVASSASEVREAISTQATLVNGIRESLSSVSKAFDDRLSAIEGLPVASAERFAAMIQSLEGTMRQQVEQLTSAHSGALQSYQRALEETLAATRSHNAELSSELEKARSYTTRVHGSLVEFTDELTRKVEAKAQSGAPS